MILPARGASVDTDRRREVRKLLKPEIVQQRIEDLLQADQVRLAHVFDDVEVHEMCREMNMEFRERDFTPAVTLGLFIAQTLSRGDACTTVIAKFNRERKRQGLEPVREDASAYCKARARLPVEAINMLGQQTVSIAQEKTSYPWKWKGKNAYLVDGFVLRAPDTQANQEAYPQPSSQKEGLGLPQVRVLVTTSLATGCITHFNTAQVEGKRTGEATLFREKHQYFGADDVVVGDSNFESFHDVALLKHQKADVVFCINATRNLPLHGVCETIDEQIVTLDKPSFCVSRFTREQWEKLPETLDYRIIRYRVSGRNEEITIVTTLLDEKLYPAEAIAELYGLRWDVELDIGCFKTTMGQCNLKCQTPENVDREIATSVLAYNLVRLLMNDTAAVLEMHPRELSFSHSRDAWIAFSDELETSNDLMWIVLSSSGRFVRNRPGRSEPRAIKQRNATKYPKLKSPRASKAARLAAAARAEPAQRRSSA